MSVTWMGWRPADHPVNTPVIIVVGKWTPAAEYLAGLCADENDDVDDQVES